MHAWNLIGTDSLVRVKGGRTKYEQVSYVQGENTVRLSRLETKGGYLQQIDRYVPWNTEMEIVSE